MKTPGDSSRQIKHSEVEPALPPGKTRKSWQWAEAGRMCTEEPQDGVQIRSFIGLVSDWR